MRGPMGCGVLMPLMLLILVVAAWLAWWYVPLTEEDKRLSEAQIVVESRYVVSADSVDLLSFATVRGDTLLTGMDAVTRDTVAARWVRPVDWLPYNGHQLLTMALDTSAIARGIQGDARRLVEQQKRAVAAGRLFTRQQKDEVEYYLRTHQVTDDGFAIVSSYEEQRRKQSTLLAHEDSLLTKALQSQRLTVRLERRYLLIDTLGRTVGECEVAKDHGTTVRLAAPDSVSRSVVWPRLPRRDSAMAVLMRRHEERRRSATSGVDSLGTYSGGRDSLARPHGYGMLLTRTGDYYEGDWWHGKRDGVGMCIVKGERLKIGEWKEDAFLGEKITHSSRRIYGIDISKHQHVKGRKRYGIDWKRLRITSLGKRSKKNIADTVDYPVSFIYIKATEGVTVRNKYFAQDYAQARRHGYRTGAYHFFSWRTTGKAQAQNFLKHSRYHSGDLAPVLDLEPEDWQIRRAGGIDKLLREVRTWLTMVEKAYGVRPVLYISQRFTNKYLPLAPDLQEHYSVWIARYGEYKPDVRLKYWQLASDGRVRGIHGDVDINVYNGFDF